MEKRFYRRNGENGGRTEFFLVNKRFAIPPK